MPTYKTKGEIRSILMSRLGYGGLGAAASNFVPFADDLLEEAQEQIFILMPDEKRVREWQFTTGLDQQWYDFPADCDIDRIINVAAMFGQTWIPMHRGIDLYHDSLIDNMDYYPQRWDIRVRSWPVNDGSELQANGNMATTDTSASGTEAGGWLWASSHWSISGGKLNCLFSGDPVTSRTLSIPGHTYDISYTIGTAAAYGVTFGGSTTDTSGVVLPKTTGTHSVTVKAITTTSLVFNAPFTTTVDNVSIKDVSDATAAEDHEQMEIWPIDANVRYTMKIEGYMKLAPFVADADRATIDDRLVLLYAEAYGKAHLNRPDAQLRMQSLNKRLSILRGQQHNGTRYVRGEKEPDPLPTPIVVP